LTKKAETLELPAREVVRVMIGHIPEIHDRFVAEADRPALERWVRELQQGNLSSYLRRHNQPGTGAHTIPWQPDG